MGYLFSIFICVVYDNKLFILIRMSNRNFDNRVIIQRLQEQNYARNLYKMNVNGQRLINNPRNSDGTSSRLTTFRSGAQTEYFRGLIGAGETISVGGTFGISAILPPTVLITAPTAPTITGIIDENKELVVAFTAPASDGGLFITGYEYSVNNGVSFTLSVSTISPLTITGLTNGQTYPVVIRAVNPDGSGPISNMLEGIPVAVPDAPTITGITDGNQQLTVAFTPPLSNGSSAITDYRYSFDNGVTSTSAGTTTSPFTITRLTNGQAYSVVIMATNRKGNGPISNSVTATPATVPSAPAITGITDGNQQLTVAFTAPATGGSVITDYLYSTNGGSFVSAGTTVSPFNITGLTNGTSYTVVIRAVNRMDVNGGAISNSVTATPATVPSAPTINGITDGNQQLTVAFSAPVSTGGSVITDYLYSTNGGSFVSAGTTVSPFNITGLTNGTSYTVVIRAVNRMDVNGGAISNSVTATPATVPSAPTINGITDGNQQLTVAFSAPATGGSVITDYLYQKNSGEPFVSAGTTVSPFTITGLTNGTPYTVVIKAVNRVDPNGGASSNSVTATPATVPTAPTIAGITDGNQQLTVAFTAPASTGGSVITDYLYQKNSGESFVSAGTTVSPFIITGLTNGTSYSVVIKAVNRMDANGGAISNSVTATPATVPSAPTINGITDGNQQLTVAFTAPVSTGGSVITDYLYQKNSGEPFVSAGTTTSPFTITGLTNGTSYTVVIRAVNRMDVNGGAISNSVTATPATVPTAPTITGITDENQQLSVAFSAPISTGGSVITDYLYQKNSGEPFISAGTTVSPFIITGLTNGTPYTVVIKAVNRMSVNGGASSNSVTATPATVPSAPTINGITDGNQQLSVAFSAPASTGGSVITNYLYSTNGGSFVSAGTTVSPFIITGLTNGTPYSVVIKAVNRVDPNGGTGSTAVSGTPATTPGAPTLDGLTVGNQQLRVDFTAPTSNGGSTITDYLYQKNSGEPFISAGTTTSPFNITGLTNGTSYTVVIKAVNGVSADGGASSNSRTATPATVPSVPIITTPITPGDKQLTVAFTLGSDGGSAITDYQYQIDASGSFVSIGTSGAPFTITGLTNGTPYSIVIKAINGIGNTNSAAVSGTPATTPGAPTLDGLTVGNQQLRVDFTAPTSNGGSTITDYLYQKNSGEPFISAGTTTSPFNITGLTNGTSYTVVIKAVNGVSADGGASSNSRTATPATVPSVPIITTPITPGDKQLTVAFTLGSDGGSAITDYQYQIDASGSFVSIGTSGAPFTITGLTNGTPYSIVIKAINGIGNTNSAPISGTPATVPSKPATPTIDYGNQRLTVRFTPPADGGSTITGYQYLITSSSYTCAGFVKTETSPPIILTGLTNGTLYSVVVLAVNNIGNGPRSDPASGTPATVPSAPTNIVITDGDKQLIVAFTAGSDGGSPIKGYQYSTDNGVTFSATGSKSTSPLTITGLTNGTPYQVRIRAVNNNDSIGDMSTPAVSATPATTPGAPTLDGLTVGNQQLRVDFTAGSNGGSIITDYLYQKNSGESFVSAGTTTSPFNITGLTNGTSYTIVIKAVNRMSVNGGASSNSRTATPVGQTSAPTITGITENSTQLVVTFNPPTFNGGSAITDYQYQKNSGEAFTSIGSSGLPFTITGLTNDVSYTIIIQAMNSFGAGLPSASQAAKPQLSGPYVISAVADNDQLNATLTCRRFTSFAPTPSASRFTSSNQYDAYVGSITDNGTNTIIVIERFEYPREVVASSITLSDGVRTSQISNIFFI